MKRSPGNSLAEVRWSRLEQSLLLWLSLLLLIGSACFFISTNKTPLLDQKASPISAHVDPFEIREVASRVVDTSFTAKEVYPVPTGTQMILIPHHLVAGREIASLLSSLSKPDQIILLSPDHFSKGGTAFSTTKHGFIATTITPTTTHSFSSLTDELLVSTPALKEQDSLFLGEHGVRALIPFFGKAWGDIPVTPITLRIDATQADEDQLITALKRSLNRTDKRILVIATIDFSHYQPPNVADAHDARTISHLLSLRSEGVDSLEIDSPPTFYVMTELAKQLGLTHVKIHAHTNSLRLMKAKRSMDSTSHVVASFSPGKIMPQDITTTLLTDDRHISTEENRFYRGYDVIKNMPRFPFEANIGLLETATSIQAFIFPFERDRLPETLDKYEQKKTSLHIQVTRFLEKNLPRQDKPIIVE